VADQNFEQIQIRKDGPVVIATISRPEALNALNQIVLRSLAAVLDWVESESDVRVLILTGAGEKAFVAGADIKQFENMTPAAAEDFARSGQKLFTRLEEMRMPVIAAVNGFALGGGLELALACDFIYAAEGAKFGLPECTLGIMPGFGGTVRLPRRIGVALARELAMSGSMLNAQDAMRAGLVNKVFLGTELLAKAIATAHEIASRAAPMAVAAIKKSIHDGASLTEQQANGLEAKLFGQLFATSDRSEGVQAFIEKRKPSFKGI
jgi:enoyl-CoA hydratase